MSTRPPPPPGPHLILGLARSGQAAALTLRRRGEEVIGVDAGAPDVQALLAAGVEVHLRSDGVAQVARARALVKSPGVPAHAPALAGARRAGVPVLGELELAWRLLDNPFIAVTGTNGKTTVSELLGHIHREAGVAVAVAGNVGTPLSSLVDALSPQAVVVCEASSFQLEDTIAFAPEAAVMLNLSEDHLDRHGSVEAYRDAKRQAFVRQANDDLAVYPCDLGIDLGGCARRVCFGVGPDAGVSARAGQLWWEDQALLAVSDLRLRGAHNLHNAMAAAAVALARGIEPDAVRVALSTFAGVSHRLEEVALQDDVLYVNDSKATNVASTLVALASFAPDTVCLILGGQGKGQDFTALAEAVAERARRVYLIGEDAPVIAAALAPLPTRVTQCGDLERALTDARRDARPGDVVLLSPACASFDQFRDFEERGERFRELAQRLALRPAP